MHQHQSPVNHDSVQASRATSTPRTNSPTLVKLMQLQQAVGNQAMLQMMKARMSSVPAQPSQVPTIQGKFEVLEENMVYLDPEFLESKNVVVVPQYYKDLYYRLDDDARKVFLTMGIPGNFDPASTKVTVPTSGLKYVIERIEKNQALDSDLKTIRTSMAQFAHEMQHAVDYLYTKTDLDQPNGSPEKYMAVMDTELRAWATEAIVYKQYNGDVNKEGIDLLEGWNKFDVGQFSERDDDLAKNVIWARVIQYSTKNGFTPNWRDSVTGSKVLTRAMEEKTRVLSHKDVQVPESTDVTAIDTLQALQTTYAELKSGGARVKKVGENAPYTIYKFKRKLFGVHQNVTQFFDIPTGVWLKSASVVQVDNNTELNQKAPELKAAGGSLKKVRKDGEYRIYSYLGKDYRVHHSIIDQPYFDQATGSWAQPPVVEEPSDPVAEDPVDDEAVSSQASSQGALLIDTESNLDLLAPELKRGGKDIQKVRREGDYRIYSLNGREYKVNKLLQTTYFDQATGSWQ